MISIRLTKVSHYWNRIWRGLTKPSPLLQDSEEIQSARLLTALLLVFTLLIAGFAVVYYFLTPDTTFSYNTLAILSILILIMEYAISRTRYYRLAAALLVVTIISFVVGIILALSDKPHIILLLTYLPVVVMISSLIFSLPVTIMVFGTTLTITMLILLHQQMLQGIHLNIVYVNIMMSALFILSAWLRSRAKAELRRNATALENERNLLRTVIDSMPDHIYVKDRNYQFQLANQAMLKWHGKTHSDEIRGQTDKDLYGEAVWNMTHDTEVNILTTGDSLVDLEIEYKDRHGSKNWILATKVPFYNSQGQLQGLIGIHRNITAQKEVEIALKNEHNLLQYLIDNLPDAVYVKDLEGRFLVANQVCWEMNNFSSLEEIIGKSDFDIFDQVEAQRLRESEAKIMQEAKPVINYEADTIDFRNERLVMLITKLPLYDANDRIIGLIGINRNITAYKLAQEQMHELTAELKQQAHLMDEVLSNTPDHINMHDAEGHFIYSNAPALAAVHLPKEAVIGKTWRDLGFPESIGLAFEKSLARVFEHGETITTESDFPTYNGTYFESILSPIHDVDGNVIAAVNTIRDITRRRKMENKLVEERNLLRALIDNIPMAIYVKDTESRFLLANELCLQDARQTSIEAILGKTDFDLFPTEYAQAFREEEMRIMETGEPIINKEREYQRVDGPYQSLLVTKIPIYDAEGNVIGIAGVNHDITNLKQIEMRTRHFAYLINNITDAVISITIDNHITSWNEGAQKLYGWQADEVMGKNITDITPTVMTPEAYDKHMIRLMEEGYWAGEMVQYQRDGTPIDVHMSVSLVRDDSGNPIGIVSLSHDITEQKVAERQRMQLYIERERSNVLRRFISDMSHDLRNPLATLKVSMYLLRKTLDDEARREHHFSVMDKYIERLEAMLEDLLSMSRLDRDDAEFEFEKSNLVEVIDSVILEQEALALARDQTLTYTAEADLPDVLCDQNMIRRALINLIVNAIHYTPEAGSIMVRVYRKADFIATEIKDTGIGIPESDIEHIFDRFFRADPARQTDTGGTGLGLSITQRIVDAHGGEITVESEVGQGSTFTVLLPIINQNVCHDIS
ncbi:MAG: PAS domain-containing protein [Anaerolineae bacterium]|nr:PAS domain-containing protein [Anaerolineae bacterium]